MEITIFGDILFQHFEARPSRFQKHFQTLTFGSIFWMEGLRIIRKPLHDDHWPRKVFGSYWTPGLGMDEEEMAEENELRSAFIFCTFFGPKLGSKLPTVSAESFFPTFKRLADRWKMTNRCWPVVNDPESSLAALFRFWLQTFFLLFFRCLHQMCVFSSVYPFLLFSHAN